MKLKQIIPAAAMALIASTLHAPAQSADPTFIIDRQVGQATGDTCQSYVLAIALAFKRDPSIPLKNWRDLRDLELKLREEVVKARDAREPSVPPAKRLASPADSAAAVEAVTGGAYTLRYRSVDEPDFGDLVSATTGVGSKAAAGLSFILGTTVRDVVISSATKIGTRTYGSGHQFAILGVDGPPDSTRQYLVLNSAAYKVKGQQAFNSCQEGLPDDPGPYFPSLSWHDDIKYKTDGGKVRAMTIVPK